MGVDVYEFNYLTKSYWSVQLPHLNQFLDTEGHLEVYNLRIVS